MMAEDLGTGETGMKVQSKSQQTREGSRPDGAPASFKQLLRDPRALLGLYEQMLLIRRFEEKVAEMYRASKITGFCHLNIGEEAAIVGAISALRPDDYLFSNYREHGHAIAKGVSPRAVMAELFGKEGGTSRGRGGSMHLFDAQTHFMGGYAIVGGSMPLACGAGVAIQYRGEDRAVMSMFGDGATNIGAFHESLNLAKLWKLPVLFVCINNLWGMGTALERASAVSEIWKRALAYDMTGERVDGMDVLKVREATERLLEQARRQGEPSLLECVTYRYRGHSMADPDTVRDKAVLQQWRARDALESFGEYLKKQGIARDQDFQQLEEQVETQVDECVRFAEESPEPDVKDLYKYVLADERES